MAQPRTVFVVLVLAAAAAAADIGGAKEEEEDSGGSRIVGGQEAARGQFPFMVGLWSKRYNYRPFCGGSLITSR